MAAVNNSGLTFNVLKSRRPSAADQPPIGAGVGEGGDLSTRPIHAPTTPPVQQLDPSTLPGPQDIARSERVPSSPNQPVVLPLSTRLLKVYLPAFAKAAVVMIGSILTAGSEGIGNCIAANSALSKNPFIKAHPNLMRNLYRGSGLVMTACAVGGLLFPPAIPILWGVSAVLALIRIGVSIYQGVKINQHLSNALGEMSQGNPDRKNLEDMKRALFIATVSSVLTNTAYAIVPGLGLATAVSINLIQVGIFGGGSGVSVLSDLNIRSITTGREIGRKNKTLKADSEKQVPANEVGGG